MSIRLIPKKKHQKIPEMKRKWDKLEPLALKLFIWQSYVPTRYCAAQHHQLLLFSCPPPGIWAFSSKHIKAQTNPQTSQKGETPHKQADFYTVSSSKVCRALFQETCHGTVQYLLVLNADMAILEQVQPHTSAQWGTGSAPPLLSRA